MEKKKRARGLAAQKAAKKSKIEQEPDTSNAQTVMLEQIVEEGDEIGEVVALYMSAMVKCGVYHILSRMKTQTNPVT